MKIAIVGYSGSGKSTLAGRLGEAFCAPVLCLDRLHWLPGWTERPDQEARALLEDFLDQNDSWIIEGNYIKTLLWERRMAEADRIYLLAFGRWRCLWRVIRRYLENRGKSRDSMAEGCPERLDPAFLRWVFWDSRTKNKRADYERLAALWPEKVAILRTPGQVRAVSPPACREKTGFFEKSA
ncbi:MAG: DNA topology modulation protein FlaR [Candidatus Faecalibacterium intestinavium]|uniref:DNA topology modulation protein FlaR n=1 Tax=Candidatus Faecalibacterium intestinavium TaxID=2838580 RepID=A0A9E2KJT5_9FIRM|nr:DNA topology modulation protein FlaR [Candidatus Faecalibacterium intestinavium]